MLDIKDMIARPDFYKEKTAMRGASSSLVDQAIEIYEELKGAITAYDDKKAVLNRLSKEVAQASDEERQKLLEETKIHSAEVKEIDQKKAELEPKFEEVMLQLPNPCHESVPEGKDEDDNKVVTTWGEKPAFDFTPKEHHELGEALDMIDIERGVKISGSRFYYLKGDIALLDRALKDYAFKKVVSKGFTPVIPPVLVRERAMYGTGHFPADRNEVYTVNPGEDDLFLVGTAEVPLINLHDNEIIDEERLPLRYVAISPCFRREAGSYGKDTNGILRVHQFEKVEMVTFCHPDKSWEEHELLRSIEEEIIQGLELPYELMILCSGDAGYPSAKTYDINVWFPGQDRYREVTSASNTTDFQTRRVNIRYKDSEGKKHILHSLNGTATSMRPLLAIMENNQMEDGSIKVPKVLQEYVGKEVIEKKN